MLTENLQTVEGFFGERREQLAHATNAGEFGVALDLGTTTLAAALVNLADGGVLGRVAMLNPLVKYGHDVLSRIRYATTRKHGLKRMHHELVAAVNLLIGRLGREAKLSIAAIRQLTAAGNTTMQHIFLGRQISTLGEFPYAAETLDACTVRASDLGIAIRDDGCVTTFPCMAAYVGGDIVSGLVAINVRKLKPPLLFLDVGTNGELILVTERGMAAASTAAGPCFEGMTISCGMRASHGAIEHVKLHGPLVLDVIGGGRPKGICGSGLLDAVAELRRTNLMNERGRLQAPDSPGVPECYRKHLFESRGKRRFHLHDGVSLSQDDIRQVQLAKAAIRAGIELLLADSGIQAANLNKVVVAGGFGFHMREESLFGIGMLPRLVGRKTAFVGNSSLEGAVRSLLHAETMEEATRIARAARVVDLSQVPAFSATFYREMRF